MYCTARSAVVGPNPKSAHTSSIHSMSVVRYFMCRAVLGSSLHRCLVRSRSRRVSSTSHQTLHGVAEAGLQSPNRSQSSARVVPRKGDRSAGRRSAASLAACASLSSRCLAPKPVASGNVSLSLMKRSSSLSAPSVSSQSAEPAGSGRTSYKDPHSMAVAVLGAWESSSGRIGRNPKSTAPNVLAMVLSNVAERCVTVGGGARLGSRAFTELGHPSSSPRSSGERRVLFFPGAEGRAVSRAAAIAARVLPCVRVRGCVDRVSEMLPLSPNSIFAASPARVCFPMASPLPIAPSWA